MTFRTAVILLLPAILVRGAEPSHPGPEIASIERDAAWAPLFGRIANKGAIYSTFTERRWFPFRKLPVVLQGELRYSPILGLSLRYTEPDDRTMILDARGLLMRDALGRQRVPPTDLSAPDVSHSILCIIAFDAKSLSSLYVLRAARDGDDWRIDLEPRSPEEARLIGSITVFGSGEIVRHLEFRRSANQRVEILIRQTSAVSKFSDTDRRKFFR